MRESPRSGCPINAAVEVLGDPWAMLILRDMVFGHRRHFRELLGGSIEGIASNILSDRLKRLVAAGLLSQEEPVRGRRAAYSLTEAGIDAVPVMVALGTWGLAHSHGDPALRVRAEVLRDGGPDLVARFMEELREEHLGVPLAEPDRDRVGDRLAAAHSGLLARTDAG
ncbi:winged helix-turn-helix transcriptional regulator [Agromyces soli]